PVSVARSSSAGSPSRSGTWRLASVAVEPAVERRFALLAERQPTLAGVGVVVGYGGAHRDVLERLREGQLSRLVDRPLQQPHGHLRALGKLLGQLHGPLEQLTRLDDL